VTIFIGGASRTGTTLIQGLICSDEKTIPATAESGYFRKLMEAYIFGLLVWQKETDFYFDSVEEYIALNRKSVGAYFEHLEKRYGAEKIIVQKEPKLTVYFPEIMQLVDDCKFIVMVRDPRDAIASEKVHMQKLYESHQKKHSHNIKESVNTYLNTYNRLFENKKILASNMLFIHYEHVVRTPRQVLQKLRDFTSLKLTIDPTTQGWETTRDKRLSSASVLDGKPISDASIGRYKENLTESETDTLMKIKEKVNSLFGFNVYLADERTLMAEQ